MAENTVVEKRFVSHAGPRQTKVVAEAFKRMESRAMARVELTGVVGGKEERRVFTRFPATGYCDDFYAKLASIGEHFDWTITAKNFKAVAEALVKATAEMVLPVDDVRITPEAHAEREEAYHSRMREDADRRREVEASHAAILAKKPAWAEALIVAKLDEDTSDAMTDYFGHKTTRTVAIGWRRGKREDFKQLREAAAKFEPTSHLGPGCDLYYVTSDRKYVGVDGEATYCGAHATFTTMAEAIEFVAKHNVESPDIGMESVEHRENYSMGGGNYLKAGHRDSTGWGIKSYDLKYSLPGTVIEDHLPA